MDLEINKIMDMKLQVNNINIDIDNKAIVKNISITAEKGEFVGIIGPNGCGKSTFLKSIYRSIKAKSGTIYFNEKELSQINIRESAKNLAVVGQFNNINFDFTVEQMVMLGRTPHKKYMERESKKDYEIVYEALKKVSMEHCASRSFLTLSGGEKQRVILARAIAQQARLIVLDEPTNHLDIKYQLQILSIVRNMDIGVVAALHDLNLAVMYCTKLYVLKNGEVISYGKPADILTKELIRQVYEVECEVEKDMNGTLNIKYFPI